MRVVSLLFHDVYLRDPAESGFRSRAADRYKLPLGDFSDQLKGLALARPDAPMLARDLLVTGRSAGERFLMSVDDGGVSYFTVVADLLEALGWRGHCFVSTDFIGQRGFLDAAQLRDLDARGHVIGSHSASHPSRFSACSVPEMVSEWSRSRRTLEDILGHAVVEASVPGGYYSSAVARSAQDAGLRLLFTSEPTTALDHRAGYRGCADDSPGCVAIGRFTIRHGDRKDLASRLVSGSPWPRFGAWASWNVKGLLKPLLGRQYPRLADRLLAGKASGSAS